MIPEYAAGAIGDLKPLEFGVGMWRLVEERVAIYCPLKIGWLWKFSLSTLFPPARNPGGFAHALALEGGQDRPRRQ